MNVPPPFRPHPLIRGGHLQTFATTFIAPPASSLVSRADWIHLPDGDRIAIHDDCPPNWQTGDSSLLLIHGLGGCHQSSYMMLTAQRFHASGTRVFRLDMRGCGDSVNSATGLNHAGRSDDIFAAINHIHALTVAGPIWVAGISLGGNQLLKLLCELGSGRKPHTEATQRIERAAAVAAPIDLIRCSDQMQLARICDFIIAISLVDYSRRSRHRCEIATSLKHSTFAVRRKLYMSWMID